MDQFSHDLTLALEETSLMDRSCGVGRWGTRRRTRSTGNLPCAPQPTEDSSSSPTDIAKPHNTNTLTQANKNIDGLNSYNITLPPSDSDEKEDISPSLRLPCKTINAAIRLGTLESDSLNETTFSPARFYKPNCRRKRKIKRMSMDFDLVNNSKAALSTQNFSEASLQPSMLSTGLATSKLGATGTGTIRKRLLKNDATNRSNIFFCGKRKRSNRDRYHDHEHATTKVHSCSMPRFTFVDEYRMRPRSYSSTSKPQSERLQPLNKGLLSKIERISQLQKTDYDENCMTPETVYNGNERGKNAFGIKTNQNFVPSTEMEDLSIIGTFKSTNKYKQNGEEMPTERCHSFSKKKYQNDANKQVCILPMTISARNAASQMGVFTNSQLQHQKSMECGDLNDFLSSSSLSSTSESDDEQRANDTDREGDDELTDWPGYEFGTGIKYDSKRKLTKKTLPQIRSDEMIGEDDTLMSGMELTSTAAAAAGAVVAATGTTITDTIPAILPYETMSDQARFHTSEPIRINVNRNSLFCAFNDNASLGDKSNDMDSFNEINGISPLQQIESEMSGETSNPFLSSSPLQTTDVREIRAGCRRIKGDRPGFSIKLSVNERLARFLQDPRQTQIRVPDIEIYEHNSLINLATLYSLKMSLDQGCTLLTKTSNTTQTVNIEQRGLQHSRGLSFSDFKRRCYDGNESPLPRK